MSRVHTACRAALLCALVWLCLAGGSSAQDVVAVLSSELDPYVEAFEGFQEAFGGTVPRVLMDTQSPEVGSSTRVVVAFGGRAALLSYPDDTVLIYCLAPGARLDTRGREKRVVKVQMLPRPGFVVTKLREIQPGLRRLTVFWASDTMADYVQEVSSVAGAFGLEVLAERVGGPDDLPDRLRAVLRRGADGLWLPPDPLLINARSFSVLKEFCWSNDVPLYVPTAGLVEKGAVASVSCSFREIGRAAGRAARQALAGRLEDAVVFPEQVETTLNLTAAANSGLVFSNENIPKADRVLP